MTSLTLEKLWTWRLCWKSAGKALSEYTDLTSNWSDSTQLRSFMHLNLHSYYLLCTIFFKEIFLRGGENYFTRRQRYPTWMIRSPNISCPEFGKAKSGLPSTWICQSGQCFQKSLSSEWNHSTRSRRFIAQLYMRIRTLNQKCKFQPDSPYSCNAFIQAS